METGGENNQTAQLKKATPGNAAEQEEVLEKATPGNAEFDRPVQTETNMAIQSLQSLVMMADAETDVSTTGLDLTGVTQETVYKAGEGTITYRPAEDGKSAELILDNAEIHAFNGNFGTTAIQIPQGMRVEIIVPEGTESMLGSENGDGINHKGTHVTISGGGTLNIEASSDGISNDDDNGAEAENKGSTLTIQGIMLNIENTGSSGWGFYEGTSVRIEGAEISAHAENTKKRAIYADDTIEIKNSIITVTGSYYDGIAVSNDGISIEDSMIAIETLHGMNTYGNTSIKNTSLTVTGSDSKEDAAIFFKGPFVIEDSTVEITSAGKAGIYSTSGKGTNELSVLRIQGQSEVILEGSQCGAYLIKGAGIDIGEGLGVIEGEFFVKEEENVVDSVVSATEKIVIAPEYTVTFDANGGSVEQQTAATVKHKLDSLPVPVREFCTFEGWWTEAESGTQIAEDTQFDGDTTVYAHWKQNEFVITFDANGGSGAELAETVTSDKKLQNLPEVHREGYLFDGWYTMAEGGTEITENTVFSENMVIYAHWTKELGTAPAFSEHPSSVEITEKGTAVFSVKVTGTTPIFLQWQIDRNDGNGWVDIDGAVSESYVTGQADTSCSGFQYRCTASNEAGTVISNPALLTVKSENNSSEEIIPPSNSAGESSSSDSDSSDDGDVRTGQTGKHSDGSWDSAYQPPVRKTGGRFEGSGDVWTYMKTDGTQARNEWIASDGKWYYFGDNGLMKYGWFLDPKTNLWYMLSKEHDGTFGAAKYGWHHEEQDGKWYFLSPFSGEMLLSWQYIDHNWYYFTSSNEGQTYFEDNANGWIFNGDLSIRPFGSMFENEKTPDGYFVDEKGRRSR